MAKKKSGAGARAAGNTPNGTDPAGFRVPASDTHGHSARQYFRCQPGHARQIDEILQKGQFPYRTRGDFHRHAMDRHIRWLLSLDIAIPSVMAQVDVIMAAVRAEEFALEFSTVFAKVSEVINRHLGNGDEGEARRFVLDIKSHVNDMPDDYRKDRYTNEIETRWGHLLRYAPKARLKNVK